MLHERQFAFALIPIVAYIKYKNSKINKIEITKPTSDNSKEYLNDRYEYLLID